MVWELHFPNSWSKALEFCPHQNVPVLSKISAAKAIAKKSLLYPSVFFSTGKKLTINCFTQLLYNAWTHFLFTRETFSNYNKSRFFYCYKKYVASVLNHHEVVDIHFSPHDKTHLVISEHLLLIGNRHLLLAHYKLTFEPHP